MGILDWNIAQAKERKTSSIMWGLTKGQKKSFMERMQVAVDLADAIEYLHSKRIIHRDLKPGNIGFDQNGTLKLFDFGLAIELPEGSDRNEVFNLRAAGTEGYMAPEVVRGHSHNAKADVYSFSIVLWEIMSLALYNDLNEKSDLFYVDSEALLKHRPMIPRAWPRKVRSIIQQGWAGDLRKRPHMAEIKDVLTKLCR